MAFGKEEAALIFRIKGDSSDAESALSAVDGRISAMAGAAADVMGPVAAVVGTATAAFTALGVAVYQVGTRLFDLARQTADYGSQIKDAADKTGLSATTLSALKIAADQSGSSLEQVAASVTKFSKLVGEAAEGSKTAAETLKRLGIDPLEAINDLDGALEKVFRRILDAPEGVLQTKLAMDAFGKAGADILPVIKSFDGDMAGLIRRAKELGVVFDDDAAAAADEFGDSMDELSSAAKGLGMSIGRQVIPDLVRAIKALTDVITDNRETVSAWFSAGITGVKIWANVQVASLELVIAPYRVLLGLLQDIRNLDPGFAATRGSVEATRKNLSIIPQPAVSGSSQAKVVEFGGGFDSLGSERSQAEEIAKRNVAAGLQYWKNYVDNLKGLYKTAIESFTKDFAQTGDADLLTRRLVDANMKWSELVDDASRKIAELEEKQIVAEKKTAAEAAVIRQERAQREQELAQVTADAWDAAEKLKTEALKKSNEERLRITEAQAQRELALFRSNSERNAAQLAEDRRIGLLEEVDYQRAIAQLKLGTLEKERELLQRVLADKTIDAEKRAEITNRLKILDNDLTQQMLANAAAIQEAIAQTTTAMDAIVQIMRDPGTDAGGGDPGEKKETIFDRWSESWTNFFNLLREQAPTLGTVLGDVAGMLQGAFQSIAQGIGQVIQNWVLYGETGPAVMRKILAAALATIAAEAAVRAIYELAAGFASLFFNPAEATAHFTAAAIFGSIAVGSALAGRAVAGNAFKQQASAGPTGANTQGSRSGTGGAYSEQGTLAVNGGRNASAGNGGVMVIRDKSGIFSQLFELEWEKNGSMRRILTEQFAR